MYGQVLKPLRDLKGNLYVKIVTCDPGENKRESKVILYSDYMKEYDNGNYRFYQFDSKETFTQNELNKVDKTHCLFCNIHFNRVSSNYCSNNCYKKHKRRLRDKSKIIYYRQFVIPIKGLDSDDYFIVCDLNNRTKEHRFVKQSLTTIVITEDDNQIPRYRVEFDITNSVKIKTVQGYKKYFLITEDGLLISRRTKKILVQTLSKTGYWTVATYFDGRCSTAYCFKVHRLVAHTFVSNPNNKPFVNHIDGIKTNNHYTNLEWVTNQENINHALEIGLIKSGTEASSAKLTEDMVRDIRQMAKNNFRTMEIVRKYSHVVRKESIFNVLKNRRYLNVK